VRRGRLLVWLTVVCVGIDGPARAGFFCGYLCGCTPGIEKTGSGDLMMEGGAWTAGAVADEI